ncbi:MAG: transposase [Firmicutes bacterium]|nr:transposase [Bacillota bacterium]
MAFQEQAVCLVLEGHRSMASVARELGVPENLRHDWVHALDEHPKPPFVGSGRLRPAEQAAARDWERRIRDWEEENAILKRAMRIFASGRK